MRPNGLQRETSKMVLRDLLRSDTLHPRDAIAVQTALDALEPVTEQEVADAIVAARKANGDMREAVAVIHVDAVVDVFHQFLGKPLTK